MTAAPRVVFVREGNDWVAVPALDYRLRAANPTRLVVIFDAGLNWVAVGCDEDGHPNSDDLTVWAKEESGTDHLKVAEDGRPLLEGLAEAWALRSNH